ncbi:MAG: thioredoxin family protein [Pseudomonadota bacterium]
MTMPTIVTRSEWLTARKQLLSEEKAFTQQRDALSARRRQLPWVKVENDYCFQTSAGERSLSDLFGTACQLIVQHFMLGDGWEVGCPSCSFWADGYDGTIVHMNQRDAAFVAVSGAPLEQIETFKARMGWRFEWVSSHGSSFNRDFHVSFSEDEVRSGDVAYNYTSTTFPVTEAPGISIFIKSNDGTVYHTYSCYARGLDMLNVTYQYLDLLPKGRDEGDLPHPMAWVRRHDEYGA